MKIKPASPTELKSILDILDRSGLPSIDCEEHLETFFVIEVNGNIVAAGGLEITDSFGLLRSIAVLSENRNKGIGRKLYQHLEKQAMKAGVQKLYLLTNTAKDYFSKLGFCSVPRSSVPTCIQETRQFRELCPESATVMFRNLTEITEEKELLRTP